jgi:hypothetical protein
VSTVGGVKALALAVVFTMPLAAAAAGQEVATPAEIVAAMDVVVAPDGAVASVVPDPGLPELLRDMLRKRVSQWRYRVPMWHGAPASLLIHTRLILQPVPTTTGDFALRIAPTRSLAPGPGFDLKLPAYPRSALVAKVGAQFVYLVHLQPDGSMAQATRLVPEGLLDQHGRELDAAGLDAVRASRQPPLLANGAAIGCDLLYPMTFTPPQGDAHSPPDLAALKSDMPDLCPNTELETKVEGTML